MKYAQVVKVVVDKYHLIPTPVFSSFKPLSVQTEEKSVNKAKHNRTRTNIKRAVAQTIKYSEITHARLKIFFRNVYRELFPIEEVSAQYIYQDGKY